MKKILGFLFLLFLFGVALQATIIIDHSCTDITKIPESAINNAKNKLHIAYEHTSHGSQITDGMDGLIDFANNGGKGLNLSHDIFEWNNGGSGGALDFHDHGIAGWSDCGRYPQWVNTTRDYLNDPENSDINVIIWSWCGQVGKKYSADELDEEYLDPMAQLEEDFPEVTFVYMTGHVDIAEDENVKAGNDAIRSFCRSNGKVLYDFADIERYDPDGNYYQYADDNCDYYNANLKKQGNWAIEWQSSHTEGHDWYDCGAAHSKPLNANQKAYAMWWLLAKLAGWDGGTNTNANPTGGNSSIDIIKNQSYTFQEGDFPYSDPDGDDFAGIKILDIETQGDLEYNGDDITGNSIYSNVNNLVFTPQSGEDGSPYATFTFKVIDEQGNLSSTGYTMTINVLDNDSPPIVLNPIGNVVVDEDASSSKIDITAVFTDSDNDDSTIAKAVYSNSDTTLLKALIKNDTLTLEYKKDQFGSATIVIRAISNGKTVDDQFQVTVKPINDRPTGKDSEITIDQNVTYIFASEDFIYKDIDGDDFAGIFIKTSVAKGSLIYKKNIVIENMECPNISQLKFTSTWEDYGSPYTIFTYKLRDAAGTYSDSIYTMTINVEQVDDPPDVNQPIENIVVDEDAKNTIIDLSNTFTDPDNNNDNIIKSVQDNSNPNLLEASVDKNTLTLDYLENQFGSTKIVIRGTSNQKQVDEEFSVVVNPINDPPTGKNDTVTIAEDEHYFFNRNDVTYNDIEGDHFSGIKIITTETAGDLEYDGIDVAENEECEDIAKLSFLPALYAHGMPYASFAYKLQDQVGDYSDSVYTMTINVTGNDDPLIVKNPIADLIVDEDAENVIFELSDVFTDPDNHDSLITISVYKNTNEELLTASIKNDSLILDFLENKFGNSTITIRGTSNGKIKDENFIIKVNPVNDKPEFMATLSDTTINNDVHFNFLYNASDIDGDTLQYGLVNKNDGMALRSNGHLVWNIPESPDNEYEITIFVTDGIDTVYSSAIVIVNDVVGTSNQLAGLPDKYYLSQNYPNPFNNGTIIKYALPEDSNVKILIYNCSGKLMAMLKNRKETAGYHTISWNAMNIPSGVYFYRMEAGKYTCIKKCILVK